MKYADRVWEQGTSTSSSTITLPNAGLTGFRAFATAYGIGTRRIPVFFGDANNGPNWMVCSCTLTSSTLLTVNEVLTSSAGGTTPPTFTAGTKDIFSVQPAAWLTTKDCIDLSDYPVDPTFTDDSTAGIQAAINDAFTLEIPRIKVPKGHYKIAGALVTNVGGYNPNAQLYIPQGRQAAPSKTIIIEGISPPNYEAQILVSVTPPVNGVVFESTITGSGTLPSVIGGVPGNTADNFAGIWNYTNFGLLNCCIRTKVSGGANSMCGLNLYDLTQIAVIDNVRIDVDMPLPTSPNPSAVNSSGIIMPRKNNHLLMNLGTIYISGYTNGAHINEHTAIKNLNVIGCWNGLVLEDAFHASWIGMLAIEGCVNYIVINGDHAITIDMYDAEHNTQVGTWYQFSKDIKRNSGTRAPLILTSHVVVGGVGISDAAWVSDTTNYKVIVGAGAN